MSAPGVFPAGSLLPPVPRRSLGEKVVDAIVLTLIVAAVLGVAWILRFLLAPIVGALLFTYVLRPIADGLENRGAPRWAAVAACGLLLTAVAVAVGVGVWPSLEAWLKEAPQAAGERSVFELQLEQRLQQWQGGLSARYPNVDWAAMFHKIQDVLQHQRRSLVEGLPAMALGALSHVGSVGLAGVIGYFLLLEGTAMKNALLRSVPNRHFERALIMLDRVDRQIAAYLIGTVAENVLVTVIMALALFALGMPNALLFAVLFGVANVIPFAGPFIGAAAGLLFSLLDPAAPSLGALALAYVVVHLVDAMLINPVVMGRSLDMHPLTVIVGIAVGGTLGGVLGMLAIIPSIAVVKAIVSTVIEGVKDAAIGSEPVRPRPA